MLFHALAVGATTDGERVDLLFLETKEGRVAIRGQCFIDCSGDGDLAAWAGAPFEKGDGHGGMLYSSMLFRIANVDPARAGRAWEIIPKLMNEAEQAGRRRFPRKGVIVRPQRDPTEWRANCTQVRRPDGGPLDALDAEELSEGEVQGRRQAWDVFDFIKTSAPGFERAYIVELGPQLGIRETRRVIGAYQVSEADVLGCSDFEDSIGVNGWPVEAHVAGDVVIKFPPIPESRGYCQLPYRMIVPQRLTNLFVAGRCASMTHDGQSAARVSGGCFVMGEAAGIAADIVLASSRPPNAIDVGLLKSRLQAHGAFLG